MIANRRTTLKTAAALTASTWMGQIGAIQGTTKKGLPMALSERHQLIKTKMTVYIQSAPGFLLLSEILKGASDTPNSVLALFGQHARTSVGVFAFPRNPVLELDMTVAVEGRFDRGRFC